MGVEPLMRLEQARKVFPGGHVGVDGIDLSILPGEFVSLLGPSGCGKTTALRLIAGFEAPTSGRILFEGADITGTAPYERPVNTVFQDYALFPHMSVGENVGFALSVAGRPATERQSRVREALDLVGLGTRERSSVSALSGGQRQRVALARAIVNRPKLLLLDEPLSALDAHLREQMQIELKSLQKSLGMTFLMVTHDQSEALAISDRIVLMHEGQIEQVASPAELYDRPATRFVAGFIGSMNLIPGRVLSLDGDTMRVEAAGLESRLPASSKWAPGDTITLGWRPEELDVRLADRERPADRRQASGTIRDVTFHGGSLRYRIALGSGEIVSADVGRSDGGDAEDLPAGAPVIVTPRRMPRSYAP